MVVVVAGLGIFLFSLASHGGENPTIIELTSRKDYFYDRKVNIEGNITPGSVNWDNETRTISFIIADETASVPVFFQGVVPDSFKPGTDLVIEGKYRANGSFEAQHLGRSISFCTICHS